MWAFYFFLVLYCIVGMFVSFFNKRIVWEEWVITALAAFITTGILQWMAIAGMTADIETWSGQIVKATHYPRWVEEYTETHSETTTDSEGHTHTRTWTDTHHRTHPEYWEAETTLNTSPNIDESFFNEICRNFGNITTERPWKSGFDSGDPNIYVSYNKTGYVYPVTDTRFFENRIKAAPSVFSFPKVQKGTPVYEWPKNPNCFQSGRLLGTAAQTIGLRSFDVMMAKLGPSKKVNVIMIGFGNQESAIAQWQQAKYVGGKKNDIVLCYGGGTPTHPAWSFVFGWTEKEICKKNLQTLLLDNPVDTTILPKIEREIIANYTIKDWHKFDYIRVEPPTWAYILFIIVVGVTQGLVWWWASVNCLTQENNTFENFKRSLTPDGNRSARFDDQFRFRGRNRYDDPRF